MSPLRRTPLARSGSLARLTPLRRTDALARMAVARKRVARSPEETRARTLLLVRSGGRCEGCGRAPATDYAHRVGRAQGGAWCPSNAWHGCHRCHMWSHQNVAEARSVGWILRRGQDPATTPALLHSVGWVLLDPTGGITPTGRGAA